MSGSQHIWSMSLDTYHRRNAGWHSLSQYEREWINGRGKRNVSTERICWEFHELFGRTIPRGVVRQVTRESALPQFREVDAYRCPGCRLKVVSSPCIVCTTNRIGEKEKLCQQKS